MVMVVLAGLGGMIGTRLPFWLKRVSFFPPTRPAIYFCYLLLFVAWSSRLLCHRGCGIVEAASQAAWRRQLSRLFGGGSFTGCLATSGRTARPRQLTTLPTRACAPRHLCSSTRLACQACPTRFMLSSCCPAYLVVLVPLIAAFATR